MQSQLNKFLVPPVVIFALRKAFSMTKYFGMNYIKYDIVFDDEGGSAKINSLQASSERGLNIEK